MNPTPNIESYLGTFNDFMTALVRRDSPDMSARQTTVFLAVYLNDEAQTVRGLASHLNVSKPAITRALDRLTDLQFAARKVDPSDRRSVLVQRTPKGSAFLRELRVKLAEAAAANGLGVAAPEVRRVPANNGTATRGRVAKAA